MFLCPCIDCASEEWLHLYLFSLITNLASLQREILVFSWFCFLLTESGKALMPAPQIMPWLVLSRAMSAQHLLLLLTSMEKWARRDADKDPSRC